MERKMKQMEELYRQSQAFREYVDKYCNSYGFAVKEALGHALVREVAGYYQKKTEGTKVGIRKITAGDIGNGIPA